MLDAMRNFILSMFMSLTMEASLHTTHFELYGILKRILIYLNGLNELLTKQSFVVKFFFQSG